MTNKLFIAAMFSLIMFFSLHSIAPCQTIIRTGEELAKNKKVNDSISSPQLMDSIINLGKQQDKDLKIQLDCKSQYKVTPLATFILSPIEFIDGKQYPTKGVWKVKYQLTRCGESKIYNAIFVANNNGDTPISKPYFPGSSYADPLLIKDAMTPAMANIAIEYGNTGCKENFVYDMRVTEPVHNVVDGGKTFIGVWKEVWTFKACDKMLDVEITFIPDADGGGTSFSTHPVKK